MQRHLFERDRCVNTAPRAEQKCNSLSAQPRRTGFRERGSRRPRAHLCSSPAEPGLPHYTASLTQVPLRLYLVSDNPPSRRKKRRRTDEPATRYPMDTMSPSETFSRFAEAKWNSSCHSRAFSCASIAFNGFSASKKTDRPC